MRTLPVKLDLDRFDRIVFGVIAGLITVIVLVALIGNNIGVQVESYSPSPTALSDSNIRIRFYDDMDSASVEDRFQIEPSVLGNIRWNGTRELVFEPESLWQAGEVYTVSIERGAKAQSSGAALKDDLQFSFRVAMPHILYLAPAGSQDRNLYMHDLNNGEVLQLTNAPYGIADYAVSPDGLLIAYTEYREDGNSDIWLYNPSTGSTNQITNCVNAACGAPNWNADGTQIAYERDEYDPVFGQAGARRIWIVDLATAQSSLLFDDTQTTGHSPTFSPTGNKIAIFSTNPPGILIYDFVGQNRVFIESLQGLVGEFSSDGSKLVYPILVRGAAGSTFYAQLEMVDFNLNQRIAVTGTPEMPIEDSAGFWRPGSDDKELAVSRRYLDDRYTDGMQVYLLNIETQEAMPLVVDENYVQGALTWSPDGSMLVMQRFDRTQQGARPEIWLYSMQSGSLQLIAEDAFYPGFLP